MHLRDIGVRSQGSSQNNVDHLPEILYAVIIHKKLRNCALEYGTQRYKTGFN